MKLWKKLLFGFAGLILTLLLAGWLLPSRQRIERSIILNGKPEAVFALTATLKRWPDWTAWTTNRFPDLTLRFAGPDTGPGATMMAAGKSSGDGTVKITAADPGSGLAYTLDFNHGTQMFTGSIRHGNAPGGLHVTWTLEADLGMNPLKRWGGLAMGSLMGGDMEQGLANLKRQVERTP